MKVAILGDIHGNYLALRAVLQGALLSKVERLLITGDLVGYYFSPLMVLELLSNWKFDAVRGNHEEMLSKARNDLTYLDIIDKRYGSGVRIAIQELKKEQLDYLCTLPHPLKLEIDNCKILLCHGAPWDIDQYVYQNACCNQLKELQGDFDFVFMGHTHYPMFMKVKKTIFVNPGSVGQPRDRKPGACWALLDTQKKSIEFHRESYDSTYLIRECQKRHPDLRYLSEVLQRT
jgi:putative phosphoesterase